MRDFATIILELRDQMQAQIGAAGATWTLPADDLYALLGAAEASVYLQEDLSEIKRALVAGGIAATELVSDHHGTEEYQCRTTIGMVLEMRAQLTAASRERDEAQVQALLNRQSYDTAHAAAHSLQAELAAAIKERDEASNALRVACKDLHAAAAGIVDLIKQIDALKAEAGKREGPAATLNAIRSYVEQADDTPEMRGLLTMIEHFERRP